MNRPEHPETKLVVRARPPPDKPKLSRTSVPKVRTGCITCKKRHIKCDEGRPSCTNCLKSRGRCEGYAPDRQSKPKGPVLLRWDPREFTRTAPPRTQLQLDPDLLDFRDAVGLRCFDEFVSLARGPWTTAVSIGDLWAVTLPQVTRNNDALRYAAMAIGALSLWHADSGRTSLHEALAPAVPDIERDAQYLRAVAYYCHALKVQSQRTSVQDAVFLSVLSLFFETLRGDRKAAMDHTSHGLALLLSVLTDVDGPRLVADLAPNPQPLLTTVADVFSHLASQTRMIIPGKLGHGRPLPHFSRRLREKKQTMESFMVLLSQIPDSPSSMRRTPAAFESLDEFEAHWVGTRRSNAAISLIMVEVIQATGIVNSCHEGAIKDFYTEILGNTQVQEFCTNWRTTMEEMNAAFRPLFNHITTFDIDSPTYLRAIHLRLQFLGAYIFEDTAAYLDVEKMHAQTPHFREYLTLAQIALRTAKRQIKNPAHQLSLQCGLALQLMIVAFFCRDHLVREEAIWMLAEYPGQDGLWSTRALHILALKNRDVERENAIEGTLDEQWQRLLRREFCFEDAGGRIVVRFSSKNEATGSWDLVEEVAEVQGEPENVVWKRQPLTGFGGLLLGYLYEMDVTGEA
ncbi:hypothetical protein GQ53DRAFT_745960 [Thozetella sp. PMI_491]|nr:hypothetical protein GQ53DRAFT_745960 [Thozetella sp. PMI_491]